MSVETAETLKHELTDKYVVVMAGVPELKRFSGLTGTVKTVNMSGRALVQFDGPADISWYDIDPSYLNVIDAPLVKEKPSAEHAAPAAKAAPAKAKPGKAAGMSPLEMARQQGAGGKAAPAKPASSAGGEKKLSPLEMARQQGAAGKAAPAKPASSPSPAATEGGKKLSPLEMARQQGAAKESGETAVASSTEAPSEPAPPAAAPETPPEAKKPANDDTAGLSPLELARRQGAAKR